MREAVEDGSEEAGYGGDLRRGLCLRARSTPRSSSPGPVPVIHAASRMVTPGRTGGGLRAGRRSGVRRLSKLRFDFSYAEPATNCDLYVSAVGELPV